MKEFSYRDVMTAVEALEGPVWRLSELGISASGRQIPLLTAGSGRKKVVYVAAHHGMERLTAGILTDFAAELATPNGERRSNGNLLASFTLYVIPMLNPDGVEISLYGVRANDPCRAALVAMNGGDCFDAWQANARGVDLNHNYDAGFEEYRALSAAAGIQRGSTRYAGEAPESEPETAALCRFLRGLGADLAGVMSLHTQGEEILCGCQNALTAKCTAIGRELTALTGYRFHKPTGLAAYGGLCDWCIETLRRPAFTLECGKGQNPLPPAAEPAIYARLRRSLFAFPGLL